MGEAKRRGSFEQRKAAAIERNKEQARHRPRIEQRMLSPKSTVLLAVMAGIAGAKIG